jgi:hypothetical protein
MRAVVIRDPSSPDGGGQLGAIQAMAPSLRLEVTPVGLREAGEIERAVTFAREANAGLIVTVSPLACVCGQCAGAAQIPTAHRSAFIQ